MPKRKHKLKALELSMKDLNENIIICLPITNVDEEVGNNQITQEDSLFTYIPEISIPSEQETDNISQFEWINEVSQNPQHSFIEYPFSNNNQKISTQKRSLPRNKKLNLEENSKNVALNRSVCMWCCHNIELQEFYLPLRYTLSEYIVFGQFCSPECAAGYNFHDIIDYSDPWERYSLLHSLYFDMYPEGVIPLALSRMSLKIFGGNLDIIEFRKSNSLTINSYKISMAPIKHIKQFSTQIKIFNKVSPTAQLRKKKHIKHPFTFLTQST